MDKPGKGRCRKSALQNLRIHNQVRLLGRRKGDRSLALGKGVPHHKNDKWEVQTWCGSPSWKPVQCYLSRRQPCSHTLCQKGRRALIQHGLFTRSKSSCKYDEVQLENCLQSRGAVLCHQFWVFFLSVCVAVCRLSLHVHFVGRWIRSCFSMHISCGCYTVSP